MNQLNLKLAVAFLGLLIVNFSQVLVCRALPTSVELADNERHRCDLDSTREARFSGWPRDRETCSIVCEQATDSEVPSDPGKEFVPFTGLDQPIHDGKIMGAVFHRHNDLVTDSSITWPENLERLKVPVSLSKSLTQDIHSAKAGVNELIQATVVIGGGSGLDFFTAGAVLISKDGLALTNYHVAEFLSEGKMVGLTADGKCHPVVEFLAGNADRDVALIRLKGNGFPFVSIATSAPKVGDNLEVIHHTENRFYTYDRGYVMRFPVLGKHPWMEISTDYAPGASGCGIFNERRELIGLVSMIQYGDGPTLSEDFDVQGDEGNWEDEEGDLGDLGDLPMQLDGTMLLVKHAVPLSAIRSLWKESAKPLEK